MISLVIITLDVAWDTSRIIFSKAAVSSICFWLCSAIFSLNFRGFEAMVAAAGGSRSIPIMRGLSPSRCYDNHCTDAFFHTHSAALLPVNKGGSGKFNFPSLLSCFYYYSEVVQTFHSQFSNNSTRYCCTHCEESKQKNHHRIAVWLYCDPHLESTHSPTHNTIDENPRNCLDHFDCTPRRQLAIESQKTE